MKRNDKRSKFSSGYARFDRSDSFNNRRSYSHFPEKHKAVCADCKKNCEVPFKPREGGRPVYCRECYVKHRPQRF